MKKLNFEPFLKTSADKINGEPRPIPEREKPTIRDHKQNTKMMLSLAEKKLDEAKSKLDNAIKTGNENVIKTAQRNYEKALVNLGKAQAIVDCVKNPPPKGIDHSKNINKAKKEVDNARKIIDDAMKKGDKEKIELAQKHYEQALINLGRAEGVASYRG